MGLTPKPFTFLRHHPILCGVMQFHITLTMQDQGMKLSDAWGSIMSVAHLYNAILNDGYNKVLWPDMEAIIQIHDEAKMFVGKRPKQAKDYFRRFAMVMERALSHMLPIGEICQISPAMM